jgi:hypothetical protein
VNLLLRESRGRLALRGVILVAPVLALLAARPEDLPHGWFVALTVVLSIGFAAMPESALGTACLVLVVTWWALAAPDGVPLGTIGAALVRRWLRRAALVALAAPLVWVFAQLVDGQPEPPGVWVFGLASAVVVCIVAAAAVAVPEGAA